MEFRLSYDAEEFVPSCQRQQAPQRQQLNSHEMSKWVHVSEEGSWTGRPNPNVLISSNRFQGFVHAPEFVPMMHGAFQSHNTFRHGEFAKVIHTVPCFEKHGAMSRNDKLKKKAKEKEPGLSRGSAQLGRKEQVDGYGRQVYTQKTVKERDKSYDGTAGQPTNRESFFNNQVKTHIADVKSKLENCEMKVGYHNKSEGKIPECDAVKSWRDVVKSKPTLEAKGFDDGKLVSGVGGSNTIKAKASQADCVKDSLKRDSKINFPKSGAVVDSRNRNNVVYLGGHGRQVQTRSPWRKETGTTDVPEWRRQSENQHFNPQGWQKYHHGNELNRSDRNGRIIYRDRRRKLKVFELEHVSKKFGDLVKQRLFHRSLRSASKETMKVSDGRETNYRGWYRPDYSADCEELGMVLKEKTAPRMPQDAGMTNVWFKSKFNEQFASKGNVKSHNSTQEKERKMSDQIMVRESSKQEGVSRNRNKVFTNVDESNKIQESVRFAQVKNDKNVEHFAGGTARDVSISKQESFEDSDEWTDEEGWTTIVDKSKQRKQKLTNLKNTNQDGDIECARNDSEVTQGGLLRVDGVGMAAKDQASIKQHEQPRKNKKRNKRKKTKKIKENVLYDNDEKKIKEFKMRQMIEEGLKQNLLELTRTKNRQSTIESDDAKNGMPDEASNWPSIGNPMSTHQPVMSYVDALTKTPVAVPSPNRGAVPRPKSTLTQEEREELRRARMKEKRKIKKKERNQRKHASGTAAEGSNDGDKSMQTVSTLSKQNITLDLGSMFDKLLKTPQLNKVAGSSTQKKPKRNVISAGVISLASGLAKKKSDVLNHDRNKAMASVNALDSTQPVRMRGKEREKPKKKKMTLLKRVIMREREAKRQQREAEEAKKDSEKLSTEYTEMFSGNDYSIAEEGDALEIEKSGQANNSNKDRPGDEKDQISDSRKVSDIPESILKKLHSRKFRPYCDHFLSKDIDDLISVILKDLQRFQTKAFVKNPVKRYSKEKEFEDDLRLRCKKRPSYSLDTVKAKSKRRFVLGLREVRKHVRMKRVKCVVLAANLEQISAEGGIDNILADIILECKQRSITTVYAKSRQALGAILSRKVPVSAIGIFNYDGTEVS
eukprot:gene6261-6981_t